MVTAAAIWLPLESTLCRSYGPYAQSVLFLMAKFAWSKAEKVKDNSVFRVWGNVGCEITGQV